MTHFWTVRFSYLGPPIVGYRKPYRANGMVGVVAPDIAAAIAEAIRMGVPPGGSDPIVWSAAHHGKVHSIVPGESVSGEE